MFVLQSTAPSIFSISSSTQQVQESFDLPIDLLKGIWQNTDFLCFYAQHVLLFKPIFLSASKKEATVFGLTECPGYLNKCLFFTVFSAL